MKRTARAQLSRVVALMIISGVKFSRRKLRRSRRFNDFGALRAGVSMLIWRPER